MAGDRTSERKKAVESLASRMQQEDSLNLALVLILALALVLILTLALLLALIDLQEH